MIKGDGPTFPEGNMGLLDSIYILEAKMTKFGGLDFETNIEWLLTSLVEIAICYRVDFFEKLLGEHSLESKRQDELQFGVNIPLLRSIANGQIFNPYFVHPKDDLKEANIDSGKCQELLDKWIRENMKVTRWGGLSIVEDNRALTSRSFSFSPNERMGKVQDYSHPRLHPVVNQKRSGDVWLFIPTTGCLPMGSFCGTYGYGIIHPNVINAAVMQMSYASSHAEPTSRDRATEPDPQETPGKAKASFDMMSIAPNFDLLLEACIAEETAKTIVRFDIGMAITLDRSPIKTPGASANKKGTPEAILKEAEIMLSANRFGIWMACPFGDRVNNPDMRCKARLDLACWPRNDEGAFARIMSRMIPHMGAHIRAYHFLCFQAQIGYRGSEQISLNEVAEVITLVLQQGWFKPAPRSDYDKYLSGGNLHLLANDFKGKARLRALWDITGYALQEGTWTNPTTVEMYFYQLAAFWSMKAPKELPTLPGIGGNGTMYHQFDTPSIFWNSKYFESLKVKKIILDDEDKTMSSSNKIVPKAVSKAPVITQQPWDPVLGDSPHAYAWWSLSTEETSGNY